MRRLREVEDQFPAPVFIKGVFDFDVAFETGASRYDVTHDNILLEAAQVVGFTGCRSFGEYAGGILEGSGRNE